MPLADYQILRQLTQPSPSGNSTVLVAERNARLFALKFVRLEGEDDAAEELLAAACQELKILSTLRHPHIVRLRESERVISGRGVQRLLIVTDFAEGGSLKQRVLDRAGATTGTQWSLLAATWAAQVCSAIAYCHEKKVIHRDIKLENVVLSAAGDALVVDFGFARELSQSGQASTLLGTPTNMAPEMWDSRSKYDAATDAWALGCSLYELAALVHPFAHATDPLSLRALVCGHTPAGLHDGAVSDATEPHRACLLKACAGLLRRDPKTRESAAGATVLLESMFTAAAV